MATQNYFKAKNGLEAPSQSTIAVTDSSFPTVRPTLNLDFAGSESVDSRITFTRASAATYTGADGKIKYAVQNEPRIDYDPVTGECKGLLIEEQRTNRLLYSSHLKVGDWTTDSGGKLYVNDAIAPDGTLTAYRLLETSSSQIQSRFIRTAGWTDLGSSQFTYSHYVKSYGQKRNVFMLCQQSADAFYAHFDIVAGTVVQSSGNGTGVLLGAGIENKGNGWYRIWISGYVPNSSAIYSMIHLDAVGSTGFGATGYQGDGLSGVYVWGPQFEAGAFPTSYIPSTTTFTSRASSATYFDSTGTLRIAGTNQARYGYGYDSTSGKWVSQGLILEAAATNLVGLSELPNSAIGASVSADTGTTGTIAGTWWNFSKHIATTGTSWIAVYQHNGSGGTLNIGTRYVASVYSDSPTSFGIFPSYDAGYIASTSYQVDTNVWRHYVTWVKSTSSPEYVMMHINGTGTRKLAGWQIEAGSFPTSYIPTSGSYITRAADVSSSAATTRVQDKPSLSSAVTSQWFNQDEGTLYSQATFFGPDSGYNNPTWYINDGTSSNYLSLFGYGNTFGWAQSSSGTQAGIQGITGVANSQQTLAFGYKINDFAFANNGALAGTDTSGSVPQVNQATIGWRLESPSKSYNGYIKKLAYYPKRLSNAQLQALTA